MEQNLMENLNKEQLKAVTHKDGPLLIVAGAGTGKTTVITQRIAYITEQGLAKADEILALTFTEKAAGEMEERVDRLLPMGYVDLWISTFHGFGERILKEHGLDIGLSDDFKLLNEFEQYNLIKKNLDKFDLDYYQPMGNPTKFIRVLIKHFSRLKDEDIGVDEYLNYAQELQQNVDTMLSGSKKKISNFQFPISNIANKESKIDKEMAGQEVGRIYEVANAYHVYQQLLLDNNYLDFGDLINYCLKLFRERPAILAKYKKQFKYILLDEFQDTNWAQYELIKMLVGAKSNLVVVGDDDQSIYKFRGASVSNILQFKKDFPKAKEIFLINNYRNKQNILDLSYDFIKQNDPNRLEFQLKSKQKLSKKLVADNKGKGIIEVLKGKDLTGEIKLVLEKIASLKIKDKELSWNNFAILVRANSSAKEFCSFLEASGLPYQFLSSRGLYAKPVIMDIVAYLKVLDNYHESVAMYRILNLPIFKFTYQELVNFNYWANKKAWSLFETLKSAVSFNFGQDLLKKINTVLALIEEHTILTREKNTSEVVLAFLNDSGYLKYLLAQDEQASQETALYLNQFIKRINEFEAGSDDKNVKTFLIELQAEIDAGEEGSLPVDYNIGPETIKVMTIHAAKGLEFKHVFIANMVDKRFPTIERSEKILIPDALVKEILPEGDIHLEEERRLFYVAMTRAQDGLYFSWAEDYGGARLKKPSRFLVECKLVQENKETRKQGNKSSDVDFSKTKACIPAKSETANQVTPSYFSYTQLAAFSNCPYQYRFAHILRIPRRGKAQFSFGRTMHNTLQKIFILVNERAGSSQGDLFSKAKAGGKKNIIITLDEIVEIYEANWIDDWYNNKKQKEKYKKKGKEILKEFYNKHKDNWPKATFLEKGFSTKIKAGSEIYTVRGMMDRVDDLDGKLRIVDYKTGAPKEKLSFEEKGQLLLYQIAAQELFKTEIDSLVFYYLDNNSEFEFLGTDEELDKMKLKMIDNILEIKKGEFPPKPSQLCSFCDFFDICEFRKN